MKNELNTIIASKIALFYIFVMGIGMFTMHHIFNYSYDKPERVYVLIFVEIALTIIAIQGVRYFGEQSVGFAKLDKKNLKWVIPFIIFIMIMLMGYFVTATNLSANLLLISLICVTTLLVGISEEIIFRGIIFHNFLAKFSPIKSIFISALFFASLHIVNILGGMSFNAMLAQFISTFLLGVTFAGITYKIKNITPLIIYHWLWDFILISGMVAGTNIGMLPLIGIALEFVVSVVIINILKSQKQIKS